MPSGSRAAPSTRPRSRRRSPPPRPPGSQAVVDHHHASFRWTGAGWSGRDEHGEGLVPTDAPEIRICEGRRQRLGFQPQAASTAPDGTLFVAGRCQNTSMAGLRPPLVMLARLHPGAAEWEGFEAPDTADFEYILSLGLWARSAEEAWLTARDTFPGRSPQPWLARFEGASLAKVAVPFEGATTSVAGRADGTVWVASGGAVWERGPTGAWVRLRLPELKGAGPLEAMGTWSAGRQLWVIAFATRGTEHVAALLRSGETRPAPLRCDPRAPANAALVVDE